MLKDLTQSTSAPREGLRQPPVNRTLLVVAAKFLEIHLDTPAKRDLLVWFMANPDLRFATFELVDELNYSRPAVVDGLRALQEAGVIFSVGSGPVWQVTSDPATCTISRAAARLVQAQSGTMA
jgi:hypothetical protein